MMASSCRQEIETLWTRGRIGDTSGAVASHSGLVLSRCLRKQDNDPKRGLLKAAQEAAKKAGSVYSVAFKRWEGYLNQLPLPTKTQERTVAGRLIVGLGTASVLETGLRLHHTYGMPIIPGSALKGLAAHYCDQVWGVQTLRCEEYAREVTSVNAEGKKEKRPGKYFQTLFGSTEDAGHIIFHDAWLVPEAGELVLDVMTPHHQDYYSGKKDCAPTDFDDPTPIPFLSVKGTFLIAVSCDVNDDAGESWADLALSLLLEALDHWGVGGKTSSGYGRLREEGETSRLVGRPPGTGPVAHAARDRARRYERGMKVQGEVIPDPNPKPGRERVVFRIEGDYLGYLPKGAKAPPMQEGQSVELWIAQANPSECVVSLTPIEKSDKRRPSKKKRGR